MILFGNVTVVDSAPVRTISLVIFRVSASLLLGVDVVKHTYNLIVSVVFLDMTKQFRESSTTVETIPLVAASSHAFNSITSCAGV